MTTPGCIATATIFAGGAGIVTGIGAGIGAAIATGTMQGITKVTVIMTAGSFERRRLAA
jgi:hypothetical protein